MIMGYAQYPINVETGIKPDLSKKLNLGCGKIYKDGWINLDCNKNNKADVYADLEKKLPFKDDTFDYVYAEHVLEHIENLISLMAELKRVCKNGAIIEIKVPHASSICAYQDPIHVRFFTYYTMDYFSNPNEFIADYDIPKFKMISKSLNYVVREMAFLNKIFNPLLNLFPRYYERLFCWIFPCGEVQYKLEVEKLI